MENSFSYQPAAGRYERMPYKYCGKSGLQLPLIYFTIVNFISMFPLSPHRSGCYT